MLASVIIVLREALEAALIVSILLAVGRLAGLRSRWCIFASVLGLFNSWLMAHFSADIADAFDGMGQELLHISLLCVIIFCLIGVSAFIYFRLYTNSILPSNNRGQHYSKPSVSSSWFIYLLLAGAVIPAISREGHEVWIYLASFLHDSSLAYPAFIGGAIGLGIGASLGVIFYFAFVFSGPKNFIFVGNLFLALIAAGLSLQIIQDLMQTGLLDSTAPVWDTSNWMAEDSLPGQLLYALIGYEARPTSLQLIVYAAVISPFVLLMVWHRNSKPEKKL